MKAAAIYADCLVSVAMFAKVDFEFFPREEILSFVHGRPIIQLMI
jgi:hypothetical protein